MTRLGTRLSLIIGMAVIAVLAIAACGDGNPTLPPKSDPAAYTQAVVQQAIDRYEDKGRDDTVAFYNSMESVDGQWYVFIADANDVLIAHAAVPENVGRYADDIRGADGCREPSRRRRRHRGRRLDRLHLPEPELREHRIEALLGRQARRPYVRLRLV